MRSFCTRSSVNNHLTVSHIIFNPSTNSVPKPAIKYLEATGKITDMLLNSLVALDLLDKNGPEVRNFFFICIWKVMGCYSTS